MKKISLILLVSTSGFAQSVNDPDFCEKIKSKLEAISKVIDERDNLLTENKLLINDRAEIHQIQINTVASYDRALDSITNTIKEKDKNWQLRLDNAVKIEAAKNSKVKPWGIGVQAGATYDGQTKPYIGVGVSYNLIRF